MAKKIVLRPFLARILYGRQENIIFKDTILPRYAILNCILLPFWGQ